MYDYFEEIKQTLSKLIAIESVKGEKKENMPFGEGPQKALNFMLSEAEKLGLKTVNYDNYVGEIIYGEGAKAMGILAHLDVVPAGKGWDTDPFKATEKDGKIYGRGTMDDKSPAVVCMYVLKRLKDEGFLPNTQIKLILGTDEESGWGCIKHYKTVAKMPDFGFSPDADFPVIYAEKGICHFEMTFPYPYAEVKELCGGERPNMVCDYARAIAPIDKKLLAAYNLEEENGTIISKGVSAHGSTPEKGKNAILPLLKYLTKLGYDASEIITYLFDDKLGLKNLCDETGHLSLSPDMIRKEGDSLIVTVDVRYPSTHNLNELLLLLDKTEKPYKVLEHQMPLFNDKNSFLIKTLQKIYNEETGSNLEPIAIGGGTYARALPLGAAFGPELPNSIPTIHQKNEYVEIDNIKLMNSIYYRAIKELSNLK